MPCVATADTNYCSLKTEPASFRTTGVPPKLCVIEEVRRKENSAPWSSVSGTGRHTDFLGQVGQAALLKELLGFCCAAQCLFSQSPNSSDEVEGSNCWMAHPCQGVRLWQLSAKAGRAPLNGTDCLTSAQGKAGKDFSILWTFLWDNIIQILHALAKALAMEVAL